jgi:hypothetical protein
MRGKVPIEDGPAGRGSPSRHDVSVDPSVMRTHFIEGIEFPYPLRIIIERNMKIDDYAAMQSVHGNHDAGHSKIKPWAWVAAGRKATGLKAYLTLPLVKFREGRN